MSTVEIQELRCPWSLPLGRYDEEAAERIEGLAAEALEQPE